MSNTESPSGVAMAIFYLTELTGDEAALKAAICKLKRVRTSRWASDDLPQALDDLLEAIGEYQWDAEQLAQLIENSVQHEQEESRGGIL